MQIIFNGPCMETLVVLLAMAFAVFRVHSAIRQSERPQGQFWGSRCPMTLLKARKRRP